jgi:virulence-associated protein VapD
MATQRRYKAINFDLDTGRLRQVFGEKGRRKAYTHIKSFLTKNGFDHKQWSGYLSLKPMSYGDVYDIVFKMIDQCPWLPTCVNQFDATNVMSETDMLEAILRYGKIKKPDNESDAVVAIDDSDLA